MPLYFGIDTYAWFCECNPSSWGARRRLAPGLLLSLTGIAVAHRLSACVHTTSISWNEFTKG